MNRLAQGVILLLLGGAVVKASVTDMYLRYVKDWLQPFLIGAGLLMLIAGLMTIIYDLRFGSKVDTEEQHDHHGHDHGDGKAPHEPRVGWLLIAPVLGLLLVAPPALGAFAAGKAGTAVLQDTDLYPPLPEGDPAQISVVDYATRVIFDKGESMKDSSGSYRQVRISGFLSDGPGGEQLLTRIMLSCCAADGRPVKVGMTGNVPDGLGSDQWVEIDGSYSTKTTVDPVNGQTIPFIDVEQWRRIDPPRNQYE
jgi:uncharacterized repeat protein (TIGR03943 family)